MEKQIKHFIAIGCLFALLCLNACGAGSQAGKQTIVSDRTEESAAPVMTEPSAPQEDTAAQDVETAAEVPGSDDGTHSASNQDQKAASGSFTGVLGTEFVIPEGFVQLDESPNIGYQYTFWNPDYEIRIVVNEIAPGSIPEAAYETDCGNAAEDPDVTYFNKGENWFVQSGYHNNGEEIFYAKESSTDRGLKSFLITYPTAGREYGDAIAADFEKNCRF